MFVPTRDVDKPLLDYDDASEVVMSPRAKVSDPKKNTSFISGIIIYAEYRYIVFN